MDKHPSRLNDTFLLLKRIGRLSAVSRVAEYMMSIGGHAVAVSGSFSVVNPATAEIFAQAPDCTQEQLDQAMSAALSAFNFWRRDDDARRSALRKAAEIIEANADSLVPLITSEQGKPLREASMEIENSCVWLRYYADLDLPRENVQHSDGSYVEILRRPLGVVAAITPWNVPVLLATWKIAPALRAGNTVVLKPSPYTPLATLQLGELLLEAFPAGVLNVVSGADPLGAAMVAHPTPRKVAFTGSTDTGKKVAQTAAKDLKRITLELGGNDPAIVLPDADSERIADQIFQSSFANSGQICNAVKRIYVHERLHDDLVEALADHARGARVGDGHDERTEIGPLNNLPQLARISELVDEAVAAGAVPVAGGRRLDRPGYFFTPTILSELDDGTRIVDEEQFGPALPVVRYRDVNDAIERANRSAYGLTASVWSNDIERAAQIAAEIDCGQASVNAHGNSGLPHLPFGGHKCSGIGVENGPWGLAEYTGMQVINRPAH